MLSSIQRIRMNLMFILLFVIIGSELADISVNKLYLFISSSQFPLLTNILGFITAAAIYVVSQHLILRYVRTSNKQIRFIKRLHFPIIHKIVSGVQYALIAILLAVILQIVVSSQYNSRLLISSILISYVSAIFILAVVARRFFYWYISNRNAVTLLYGLATAVIAINLAVGLVLSYLLLIGQPVDIYQTVGSESPSVPSNIVPINQVFFIVSILSFILTWIATVFVLRHYSRKLGMVKYWVLVSIPLVYFLTQFQPFAFLYSSYALADPTSFGIIYTVIFSASKPVGGLLFAAAFWTMAKKITSKQVRDYMIIAAFGLALIFGSEQAIVLANRPYPPFGLPTVSFLGMSAYLVLVGIYSSAISISEDSKLRQSIRNFALKETKLLDSIGMAQMEQQIEKRVVALTKQNQDRLAEESGIQSSLTEEDMKEYLEQVIEEVKKRKAPS
jgi:hypothetical protein